MPVEIGFVLQPDEEMLDRCEPLLELVDYAEVAPETTWYEKDGQLLENGFHRRFRELSQRHALSFVAHGVAYSLGNEGDDERRKRWLERLHLDQETFDFRWYTDHLCATRLNDEAVTLPVALPLTTELADRVRVRLREMGSVVPISGVETTVYYYMLDDPMHEPTWLNELLREPSHRLLLDLHNVYTSGLNLGFDPDAWLERLDLSNVIEIHLSGGAESDPSWLPSGRVMRLDAHSDAIPEPVLDLFERWAPRCPHLRGVTLERMEGTVSTDRQVEGMRGELERIRSVADALTPEPEEAFEPVPHEAPRRSKASPGSRTHEAALALSMRSRDPLTVLRDAGLTPNDEDGVRLAALLSTRLRFERLLRGSGHVEAWFEEDPEDFTEAFRAYHAEVPMRATFPPGEARDFDAWLRRQR